ncbi:signal peptidase II [Clostridium paraputrificum]|uniref:signal peptidase II n=1 Tax=Clostridium paraputrificum TaxID=29363 RepID=UPI003D32485D
MKKTKLLTIGVLPLMWTFYFLFELFTGRVTDKATFLGNIALIILFGFTGYLIHSISLKYNNGFNTKKVLSIFIILMLIDQGIKLIIKFFFFNDYFSIIKNFLSFNPIINTDGSWLNARFGTGVSFPLLISINFISLILFIELYRYVLSKSNKSFSIDMCFLFIFAGALCSLIDKIFYGGSLDFIGIGTLFIADIKDIYINLGILFFVISIYESGYINSEEDTTLKEDIEGIKRFVNFAKKDIISFFKK